MRTRNSSTWQNIAFVVAVVAALGGIAYVAATMPAPGIAPTDGRPVATPLATLTPNASPIGSAAPSAGVDPVAVNPLAAVSLEILVPLAVVAIGGLVLVLLVLSTAPIARSVRRRFDAWRWIRQIRREERKRDAVARAKQQAGHRILKERDWAEADKHLTANVEDARSRRLQFRSHSKDEPEVEHDGLPVDWTRVTDLSAAPRAKRHLSIGSIVNFLRGKGDAFSETLAATEHAARLRDEHLAVEESRENRYQAQHRASMGVDPTPAIELTGRPDHGPGPGNDDQQTAQKPAFSLRSFLNMLRGKGDAFSETLAATEHEARLRDEHLAVEEARETRSEAQRQAALRTDDLEPDGQHPATPIEPMGTLEPLSISLPKFHRPSWHLPRPHAPRLHLPTWSEPTVSLPRIPFDRTRLVLPHVPRSIVARLIIIVLGGLLVGAALRAFLPTSGAQVPPPSASASASTAPSGTPRTSPSPTPSVTASPLPTAEPTVAPTPSTAPSASIPPSPSPEPTARDPYDALRNELPVCSNNADCRVYRTVAGDYLIAIAARFGVSLDSIIDLNENLRSDPSLLRQNQEIRIPDGA